MGAMNASGWVLLAAASEDSDAIWDLLNEFAARTGAEGPTVHAMGEGLPRYCVHPDSSPGVEFRDDNLRQALLMGAVWKASQMPEDDVWRRD